MVARASGSLLVGRDREVAALRAATEEARAGAPRCVVVTGEAGIGKTRLVSEAVAGLEAALMLTGHAVEMTTGKMPFGVVVDTLRDLRHQRGSEALTPAERTVLSPLLPGPSAEDRVDPARLLGGALDLLARLSSSQLLVWVVEDLHWADPATCDLVNLAARTIRGPFVVLATVRTGEPGTVQGRQVGVAEYLASLERVPHARRMDLQRLTDEQVHQQLLSLGGDLPPAARREIARLSDGVPFVVEELAHVRGRVDQSTLAAAWADRVARLDTGAGRLVETAAIGSAHLRIGLAEQVVGASPEGFDAALEEATDAGILTCDYTRDQLGFRHALLREAVDARIGPGARRAWHRRWAEAIERNPTVLAADPATLAMAEHWCQSGDVTRAVSAAFTAIPAARRISSYTHQMRLWHRILEGWGHRDPSTPVGRLSLRQAIGEALREPVVDDDQLLAVLTAAERLPLEKPERLLLGVLRPLAGAAKGVAPNRDAAVRAAGVDWLAEPPDELTLTALTTLGRALPETEAELAERFLARAESLAASSASRDRLIDVAGASSRHFARLGDVETSIRVVERALQTLGPADVYPRLGFAGGLAWNYVLAGRHRAADALLTNELETTPHLETMPELWEHLVENATFNWVCIGQWTTARRVVEHAAPWWPDDVRLSNLWLAHLDLLQGGATDESRWHAHLGQPISGGPKDLDLRHLLARAAGVRGDLAAMRELIAPVWGASSTRDFDTLFQPAVNLARLEADSALDGPDRTDRAQAAEHLATITESLSSAQHPLAHDHAAAAELAAQDDRFHGRDPRQTLAAALTAWEQLDHVPDVAVTHLSLAEAHAEAGDRDAAREHLVEGRRIAAELGAGPWLDRAATIAHRYGFATRARRPEDVLTSREAEVLELLAEGRTNLQIADTLFIAPKTASVHVSRIIAKMGASNRTEAVGIARRHGLVGPETADGSGAGPR